jgi:hypothetical protein
VLVTLELVAMVTVVLVTMQPLCHPITALVTPVTATLVLVTLVLVTLAATPVATPVARAVLWVYRSRYWSAPPLDEGR